MTLGRLAAPVCASLAALFWAACGPSPAEEALARCEAAGDAYAASQEAYEQAAEGVERLIEALTAEKREEWQLPLFAAQLRARLEDVL